jgi:adenylosuccinate lyase
MDRKRYEYALSLVDSLDRISDHLDDLIRHVRKTAVRHPQVATELLTFAVNARKLYEITVDPVLCDWRQQVHRHEDRMCDQARSLAPGFFHRVMQLRGETHDD